MRTNYHLIAALAVVSLLAGCATSEQDTEFDRYVQRCHGLGGIVSGSDVNWSTASFKCIGTGSNELMPRFAYT
jgi:hypothetical protein